MRILYLQDGFFGRSGETTREHHKSFEINVWLPFPSTIEIWVICQVEKWWRHIREFLV